MTFELERPLLLDCTVQHYAWGRAAARSIIPSLLPGQIVDKPYAELWMGAHPKAPATLLFESVETPLDVLIARFPDAVLGEQVARRFSGRLPFLFKILSIRTALSIQAHPNKSKAEQLHAEDPEHYPDDNHKPEVAIALSPVSLLYGFRPIADVLAWAKRAPEFAELLGADLVGTLSNGLDLPGEDALLKQVYQQLFRTSAEKVTSLCHQLFRRLESSPCECSEEQWIVRLASEYPEGDVGLFSFFVLNLVTRIPGEGLFIGPSVPHAYLEGELAECMANSDNVIRAGLTPKYRDVATLLDIADYSARLPEVLLPIPSSVAQNVTKYTIPAAEFAVTSISGSTESIDIASKQSVELLFCIDGSAELTWAGAEAPEQLRTGSVYLLPAAMPTAQLHCQQGRLFLISVP